MPVVLESTLKHVSAFYNEKHNGRTLSWLNSVGDRFDNTIAFFWWAWCWSCKLARVVDIIINHGSVWHRYSYSNTPMWRFLFYWWYWQSHTESATFAHFAPKKWFILILLLPIISSKYQQIFYFTLYFKRSQIDIDANISALLDKFVIINSYSSVRLYLSQQ